MSRLPSLRTTLQDFLKPTNMRIAYTSFTVTFSLVLILLLGSFSHPPIGDHQRSMNVLGCTDPEACNYDPSATEDDASCVYTIDCNGTCGGVYITDDCGNCFDPNAFSESFTITFEYTGNPQVFTVPEGVNTVQIEAFGASGHSTEVFSSFQANAGGQGGQASGDLEVTPGQSLYIYSGGQGTIANVTNTPLGGGWNGGGNGMRNSASGNVVGGGGGASDVRTVFSNDPLDLNSLNSRVIVAGGGGGATGNTGCTGGHGGGLVGQTGGGTSGGFTPGTGGTQSAGGGSGGALGQGGNAIAGMTPWNGGGGGGFYGGGVSIANAAGGGGSSYIGGVINGFTQQGGNVGHGYVAITYTTPGVPLCYEGCTDPEACNYDFEAGIEDGSCILPDGCTDPIACNYDESANCDDGSCSFAGCDDESACNFDPQAGCDDGSCIFYVDCAGNCGGVYFEDPCGNCYDPNSQEGLLTFNFTGNVQEWIVPQGVTEINVDLFGARGASGSGSAGGPGGFGAVISGTMSVEPGSTLFIAVGGQNGYNGGGNPGNGNAGNGGGATDIRIGGVALANRVVVAAGGGGGGAEGCVTPYAGGGGGNAGGAPGQNGTNWSANYGGGFGGQLGVGGEPGIGCSSSLGTAGSANGVGGNGTTVGCSQSIPGGGGGGGGFVNGGGGGGGSSRPNVGHCKGSNKGGGGGGAGGSNLLTNLNDVTTIAATHNGNGQVVITWDATPFCLAGCTDEDACNFDPEANVDDDSCFYPDGCTDPEACNFDEAALCENGSCTYSGCTDPEACNYDLTAGCDDQSCIYSFDCAGNCGGPFVSDDCGNCFNPQIAGQPTSVLIEYSGAPHPFTVPEGVSLLQIETFGASGHSTDVFASFQANAGGEGGQASGELEVVPGQTLYIYCGGQGTIANVTNTPMGGGWNGGGNGMRNSASGNVVGGGGGASDVRTVFSADPLNIASLNSRVIVAGGGGGATGNTGCTGGAGGGLVGQNGGGSSFTPGTGGTQTAGGNAGGALGQGGNALAGMTPWNGGGGGGYYGGGVSVASAGGGGGSSYIGGVENGSTQQGGNVGNGYVIITYNEPAIPECLEGCTDPEANNYNPDASIDNETCVYSGCTDVAADNYNPSATLDDGSCLFFGCTDVNADNYDANANSDDGTCVFLGCTDPLADNYDPTANQEDDSCIYLGCTDPFANNYDPQAIQDDGSCVIAGCTDIFACNYDVNATDNDGSCEYISCQGCTYPDAINYDSNATLDDGSCVFGAGILGCTYLDAINYDANATLDDGSCTFDCVVEGCTDAEAINFMPTALDDDGSCIYDGNIYGCMYSSALNFSPQVTRDNGTCLFSADFDPCPADLNGDGLINASDLGIFLGAFGTFCSESVIPSDLFPYDCDAENVFLDNGGNAAISDVDGNLYRTVIIAGREWMAENLRVTHFANGDPIPQVSGNEAWAELSITEEPGWCHYNNDDSMECPYGSLYNWYTINDCRNVCPSGWHIPTESEMSFMENYIGGPELAGGKLKAANDFYWLAPNTEGLNSTGFSGLPAGYRDPSGTFNEQTFSGHWWSATSADDDNAHQRHATHQSGSLFSVPSDKNSGFSIRCVRDF